MRRSKLVCAAILLGGVAWGVGTGHWIVVVAPIALCVLILLMLFAESTSDGSRADRSSAYELSSVVNRATGTTLESRLQKARDMYNSANFRSDEGFSIYTHRGRDWYFDSDGANPRHMESLRDRIAHADIYTFGILVILVRSLPGELEQPAVIVVEGLDNLRSCEVREDSIKVPGYDPEISARSIEAFVGFASSDPK